MNDWHNAEEQIERAHELYEAGRWDEAEAALRQALSVNPYQAEWQFNLGLTLEAAGRLEDALNAFQASFELSDESDPQSALILGVTLIDLDRAKESIEWLERSLELAPTNVDAHVHLIDAFALLERHDDAELHFYMAIQLNPHHAGAHAALAESLLDRKEFDRAVWCLREAARLDPNIPRVHARLARAYSETGRLERARQLYLRELRQNPGDIETIVDLGRLLIDMNRLSEAGEKLRRALELEPDHTEAHMSLGELSLLTGERELARRHFDVVTRLDASYGGARRRLAAVLLEDRARGDQDRAGVLLREETTSLEREPSSYETEEIEELFGQLLDAGLFSEAKRTAERLIERKPCDAASHHSLSVAQFGLGMVAEGVSSSRRALRLRANYVAPMHNLAVAHLRRGEINRSRYWVKQGLAIEPEDRGLRRLRTYLRVHAVRNAMQNLGLFTRLSRRG
jgi:tetratricopeptide (TPR) repeat protein